MRAIAEAAGANVASANYHYGSKLKLFEAAFEHCAAPINVHRLHLLDTLMLKTKKPNAEAVVRAFVDVGHVVHSDPFFPRLVARIFVEPQSFARPLLERVFGPVVQRFVEALALALPALDRHEIEWRFHFVIGAMLQLIRVDHPLHLEESQAQVLSPEQQTEALLDFVVPGLIRGSSL